MPDSGQLWAAGAQAHTGSKHEKELSLLHAGTILGTT